MLAVNKHVLVEYILAIKMGDEMVGNTSTKINYEPLCDCDIILRLIYVLPKLEAMQNLSKLAQDIDNFVGGSITIGISKRSVKLKKECKGQLWIFVYLTLL